MRTAHAWTAHSPSYIYSALYIQSETGPGPGPAHLNVSLLLRFDFAAGKAKAKVKMLLGVFFSSLLPLSSFFSHDLQRSFFSRYFFRALMDPS